LGFFCPEGVKYMNRRWENIRYLPIYKKIIHGSYLSFCHGCPSAEKNPSPVIAYFDIIES